MLCPNYSLNFAVFHTKYETSNISFFQQNRASRRTPEISISNYYRWTGNPVYPLYQSYFNPGNTNQDLEKVPEKKMNHFLVRKFVYKEAWWQTALIPVRIFFQGEDDNPKYFDGLLNPFLFFLPLLAFLKVNRGAREDVFEKKLLVSFSVLYILAVFFQQDMRIRWIGPAIPALVVLSAYGLKNILAFRGERENKNTKYYLSRCIVYSVVISALCINFFYTSKLYHKVDPLPYIFNRTTRSEYIEKFRPEYAALQFANNNLGQESQFLALFLGNRRYYSVHEIRFDFEVFEAIVKRSNNYQDIVSELKEKGYTDLILNYKLFNDWVHKVFTNDQKTVI